MNSLSETIQSQLATGCECVQGMIIWIRQSRYIANLDLDADINVGMTILSCDDRESKDDRRINKREADAVWFVIRMV